MKTQPRLLVFLAVTVFLGTGLRLPEKGQCSLMAKPILVTADEQVWRLTLGTREPARYEICCSLVGGRGTSTGYTSPTDDGLGYCEDTVWLVFSKITPGGGAPAFLKTLIKKGTGTHTCRREIDRDTPLGNVIAAQLVGDHAAYALNSPILLADLDGQRIRLMVGDESYRLDSEPGGAANAAVSDR